MFIWTSICTFTPRPLVLSYCDAGYLFPQGPLCIEFGLVRSVRVDETHMYFQTSIINDYIINMHILCMNLHWTFDGTAEGETCTAYDLFPFARPRSCLHSNKVVWDVKLPSNSCMDIKYKLVSM